MFAKTQPNAIPKITSNQRNQANPDELKIVMKQQALRVLTLSVNFAALNKKQEELAPELVIKDIPPIAVTATSIPIVAQLLDTGRANSSAGIIKGISFFNDPYHRESFFNGNKLSILAEQGCVFPGSNPHVKLIALAPSSMKTVFLYFAAEAKRYSYEVYTLRQDNLWFQHSNSNEKTAFLEVPTPMVSDTLHLLGMLGALPNRDGQLKTFADRWTNSVELRAFYLKACSILHKAKIDSAFQGIDEEIPTQRKFSIQRNTILALIATQNEPHSTRLDQEQRRFYYQLLHNFIHNLTIDEAVDDLQHTLQMTLCLVRIEHLLQACATMTYSGFLRAIEACIEEFLMTLTLNAIKNPVSAAEVITTCEHFIEKAVDIKPQVATLRSSCMQAIWSALEQMMDLHFLNENKSLSIFISRNIYFEVVNIVKTLFHVPNYRHEEDLSITIDGDYQGQPLPYHTDVIYDVYLANFESNALFGNDCIQFIDINDFVENQFRLRKEKNSQIHH